MTSLLAGLTGKLADRWVALLALPGVAFALMLLTARELAPLGAAHALDLAAVSRRIDTWTAGWAASTSHRLLLLAVGGAVAAGSALLAAELAGPIGRLWLGDRPWQLRLLRRSIAGRRARAAAAAAELGRLVPDAYLPERATRIGDAVLLTQRRVRVQYGVALGRLWPRLWQLCTEAERALTQRAWDAYCAAAVRTAWALGYLAVAALWWPSALVGAVLAASAVAAARRAARELAAAVEALVDLKIGAVATTLGLTLAHGRFTAGDAPALETLLDKGATLPLPSGS